MDSGKRKKPPILPCSACLAAAIMLTVVACGESATGDQAAGVNAPESAASAIVGKWAGACGGNDVVMAFFPGGRAIEKYAVARDSHDVSYRIDGETLHLTRTDTGKEGSGRFSVSGDTLSFYPPEGNAPNCSLTRRPGRGTAEEIYILGGWNTTDGCDGTMPYISVDVAGTTTRVEELEFREDEKMIADELSVNYSFLGNDRIEVSDGGSAVVFGVDVSANSLALTYRSETCELSRE